MRPLGLAVETRQNISDMIVTTLERLSLTVNTSRNELWKKVYALMTDSVSKNLHIETQIAAALNSTHIPINLLCVSHTCEVFDRGNTDVLSEIEKKLCIREKLISHMPSLKQFLYKGKSAPDQPRERTPHTVAGNYHWI